MDMVVPFSGVNRFDQKVPVLHGGSMLHFFLFIKYHPAFPVVRRKECNVFRTGKNGDVFKPFVYVESVSLISFCTEHSKIPMIYCHDADNTEGSDQYKGSSYHQPDFCSMLHSAFSFLRNRDFTPNAIFFVKSKAPPVIALQPKKRIIDRPASAMPALIITRPCIQLP